MSKFLKLVEWTTVPRATEYLSTIFGEEVNEADVLQLALENKITLSVNFTSHTYARKAKLVPLSKPIMAPRSPSGIDPYSLLLDDVTNDGMNLVEFNQSIENISGVWDLPLIGVEHLYIRNRYQQLTGGPVTTPWSVRGAFIQRAHDLRQILAQPEEVDSAVVGTAEMHRDQLEKLVPATELPNDAQLVVRTDELRRFQSELHESDGTQRKPYKPPDPREEASNLRIIGGLLKLIGGKTLSNRDNSIFKSENQIIEYLVNTIPHTRGISRGTLQNRFRDAKKILGGDEWLPEEAP